MKRTGLALIASMSAMFAFAGSASAVPLAPGNILVSDPQSPGGAKLIEIDVTTGFQTAFSDNTVSPAIESPTDVVFGPNGELYTLDIPGSPSIVQLDRNTGTTVQNFTNLRSQNAGGVPDFLENTTRGLTVLPNGDLLTFTPQYGPMDNEPTIFRVNPVTGRADLFTSPAISPADFLAAGAFDLEVLPSGIVVVAQQDPNPVLQVLSNGAQQILTNDAISNSVGGQMKIGNAAIGLGIEPSGDLLVTTVGDNEVVRVETNSPFGSQLEVSSNAISNALGGPQLFQGQLNDVAVGPTGIPYVAASEATTDRVVRVQTSPQLGRHEAFADNTIGPNALLGGPAGIAVIPPLPATTPGGDQQTTPTPTPTPVKKCKKGRKLKKGKCVKKKKKKKKK